MSFKISTRSFEFNDRSSFSTNSKDIFTLFCGGGIVEMVVLFLMYLYDLELKASHMFNKQSRSRTRSEVLRMLVSYSGSRVVR
jgi:hypothetical protein